MEVPINDEDTKESLNENSEANLLPQNDEAILVAPIEDRDSIPKLSATTQEFQKIDLIVECDKPATVDDMNVEDVELSAKLADTAFDIQNTKSSNPSDLEKLDD